MTPRSRSLSGAALMLMIIPLFAGLLACMPVPIGDPERSRIDPDLTGIWVVLTGADAVDESGFYVFEPYDKRTWLVTGVPIEEGDDSDLSAYDLSSYEGFVELSVAEPVDEGHVYTGSIVIYKAWLKKLGGELFMTWEPKVLLDDGTFEPEIWFVYRVLKDGRDKVRLRLVDGDADLFDDVKETRRAYERVIAKNVDNLELYVDDSGTADFEILVRVQETEMGFVEDLLQTVIGW